MKKRFLIALIAAAGIASVTAANAAANGFYVGGQFGQSFSNYSVAHAGLTSATSTDKKGFAGRVYGGYKFDENWSAELGYTNFAETQFNAINGGATNGKIDHHSFDVTGKATLPFNNNWSAYGKLGLARTTAKPDSVLRAASTVFNSSKTKTSILYGVGVGYEANDNLVLDASYTRNQSKGVIRNNSLLAIGVTYHFG